MRKTLQQFFDDVHALTLFITSGPIATRMAEEDRDAIIDALVNFRRRKPKKETV